jgi:hypothetical protein
VSIRTIQSAENGADLKLSTLFTLLEALGYLASKAVPCVNPSSIIEEMDIEMLRQRDVRRIRKTRQVS